MVKNIKFKNVLVNILDLLFSFGIPAGLVIQVYFSNLEQITTKNVVLSPAGIVVLILIGYVFNKVYFKSHIEDERQKMNNHISDYELMVTNQSISDTEKENIKNLIITRSRKIETYNRVQIFIYLFLAYTFIWYVHNNIKQVYAVLGFTILSNVVSAIIKVLNGTTKLNKKFIIKGE